jgi:beta-lactamase regulating signal transducer with metallopeptidase domain/predicted  nucleic acid-binding Zn-ribbon protein
MLLFKATLLWSMALAGAALLRNAHAAERHRLWTIGFAAVLLLPLLSATLPSLDIPVPSWPRSMATRSSARSAMSIAPPSAALTQTPVRELSTSSPITGVAPPSLGSRSTSPRRTLSWPFFRSVLLAAWAVGTGAAIAMILLSLARVNRLRRTGDELRDASWRELARSLGSRLGLAAPVRLIVHDAVRTPMAGGVWRPAIFLPASALTWSDEQRAVVLAHELAHVRKRDPLRLVAARLAVAVYWFHPLAWLAARQSSVAREQACDAAVLAIGTRPSIYARVLLEFAESITARPLRLAALPIVEPSLLEVRLMEILKSDPRRAPRSRVLLPLSLAATATLTIAAARPLAITMQIPNPAGAHPTSTATIPVPVPTPPADHAVQRRSNEFACWSGVYGSSFSGSLTTTDHAVVRQIGRSGPDRIIQESLGDLRVCMLAQNVGEGTGDQLPSGWIGHADRVLMEARRGNSVQRLTLAGSGGQEVSWTVNGVDRPFDGAAGEWRGRMLALLDLSWQISSIRGQVSSLRGDISSIRGEESSLRGEISSLRGEVSSMRGDQSSIRGEESSLRGDISSIQGHVSSLRGEISSEEGEISSLSAARDDADASERSRIDARIAQHRDEIKRIERELTDYNEDAKVADVEKQIKALDADAKIRAIDEQIRQFDLDGKVAKIEQQIKDLDVSGKVATIEKQIDALDADRKVHDLENRRDKARSDLEAVVGRIR